MSVSDMLGKVFNELKTVSLDISSVRWGVEVLWGRVYSDELVWDKVRDVTRKEIIEKLQEIDSEIEKTITRLQQVRKTIEEVKKVVRDA
jgi:hypothetical protein